MEDIIKNLTSKEIGGRIRVSRTMREMTMAELGLAIGRANKDAAASYIRNLEIGGKKHITEKELALILKALQMSPDEFMGLGSGSSDKKSTTLNPLFVAVPGIETLIETLGSVQKINDPAMEKMVLGHIRDAISKAIDAK